MERIIRKILNYDINNPTQEKRDELVADVTALSMFLLDKTKYFDVPDNIQIEDSKQDGGSYGEDLMTISRTLFLDSQQYAFENDITIIAHEACHYVQDRCKNSEENVKAGRNFNYTQERYDAMFYFIVQFLYPQYFQAIQMFGPKFISNMNDDLAEIYDYFTSFYELQSYEIEANQFSIKFLKHIIQTAKKLDLNDIEKKNLAKLEETLPLMSSYNEKIKHYKKLRQDSKVVRRVRFSAMKVVEYMLGHTEFVNYLNRKCVEIEEGTVIDSVLDVVCQYLELNYDEDFAKKVMNMLINAKRNRFSDRYLFQIAFWTPYAITKKEEEKIRELLKDTEIDIKKLSYEELLKEKKRVVNEREDMMRKRNKPVRTFNFD